MMEIRKIIEIDAPIDVVFKALTDSKTLLNGFQTVGLLKPKLVEKCILRLFRGAIKWIETTTLTVKS
jgi:hypothetical protein